MEERKARGLTQNIYLIDIITERTQKTFEVMGTSGSTYNVKISNRPECSCLDFKNRRRRCKHIYFVLMRIMGLSETASDEPYFSNLQLEAMYKNTSKVMRPLRGEQTNELQDKVTVEQKPTDDLCPICLDNLENGEPLDYCQYGCGKSVHVECFSMWVMRKKSVCVFCSKEWFCK